MDGLGLGPCAGELENRAEPSKYVDLVTAVVCVLFQSPVNLARRAATLDQLSDGRLRFGVGQGWMNEEFAVSGVPPKRKGTGFEEHIAAMRAMDPSKLTTAAAVAGFAPFGAVASLDKVAEYFGHHSSAKSIQSVVGLSGSQLGIGLAILRFAALGALPLASLADRWGRVTMMRRCRLPLQRHMLLTTRFSR